MKNNFSLISLFILLFCLNSQGQKIENKQYIIIDVYTGDLPGAGTDRTVNLSLNIGDETVYIKNISQYISGNALERSSSNRFTYPVSNLGEIKGITVILKPNNTINDKWNLNKIIITKPNKEKVRLEYNGWLDNGTNFKSIFPIDKKDPKIEYQKNRSSVKIVTSALSKAGTNANVYLSIKTEHGHSSTYKLNSKITGNAFESGNTDVVYLDLPYFEDLHSINIRHDNKGSGAGWNLKEIRITNSVKKEFVLPCNCWMEGDHNQRTLFPIGYKEATPIYLQSAIGGKYLHVQWGKEDNFTPLEIWTENRDKAQQFYLERTGANYYRIKTALNSNKFIAFSKNEARNITYITDGNYQTNDKWLFEKLPNSDYYTIRSKTGLYLDVQWAADKNGTPIWLWERNGGIAQQWRIMRLENGKLVPITLEDL